MPRIGTRVPSVSTTSRAVPSPPANRTRSTSRAASSAAAVRVSSAVVGTAGRVERRRPGGLGACSAPISPSGAMISTSGASAQNAQRPPGARGRHACCIRDRRRDGCCVVASFSAWRPRFQPRSSRSAGARHPRRSSAATSSAASRAGQHLVDLLAHHERRERDQSASGKARVMRPRSNTARHARADAERAVEGGRGIARRQTRRHRSAPSPAPRRRVDGRRTPPGCLKTLATTRRLVDEPVALDDVEFSSAAAAATGWAV